MLDTGNLFHQLKLIYLLIRTKMGNPKCVICGKETIEFFNLKFKAVPICDDCSGAITKQNVIALVNDSSKA